MFDEQFEVMVQAPDGELCSYACLWVDSDTKSAFVEPVSTREKYRSVVWEKPCSWLRCAAVKKMVLHVRMLNLLMYGERPSMHPLALKHMEKQMDEIDYEVP